MRGTSLILDKCRSAEFAACRLPRPIPSALGSNHRANLERATLARYWQVRANGGVRASRLESRAGALAHARHCHRRLPAERRRRCLKPLRPCKRRFPGVLKPARACAEIFRCGARRFPLPPDADCVRGCNSPVRTRVSKLRQSELSQVIRHPAGLSGNDGSKALQRRFAFVATLLPPPTRGRGRGWRAREGRVCVRETSAAGVFETF